MTAAYVDQDRIDQAIDYLDGQDNLLPNRTSHPESKPIGAVVRCLDDVENEEVAWLWDPYLPSGKVTLLEGDPASGKTFLALKIAAQVTTGLAWPWARSEAKLEPGRVLFLSCEDGIADTIKPRFQALGGDESMFYIFDGRSDNKAITLGDTTIIEDAIHKSFEPKLIVIDPIQGFLGANCDMHRANQVRPLLSGIGKLAQKCGCAVLLIRHLSKMSGGKALYRGLGSIDFTAHARSVLRVWIDPDTKERVLVHIKNSLAPLGPSWGYKITEEGMEWTKESSIQPEDLEQVEGCVSALNRAIAFLLEELQDGPVPSKALYEKAAEIHLCKRTLERAKCKLHIKAERVGGKDGEWRLRLPSNDSQEGKGCQDGL